MQKIIIAGGSGLIGKRLAHILSSTYEVGILTRNKAQAAENFKYLHWNPDLAEIQDEALDADVIINLAGAGIADRRWTTSRKDELIKSRVDPTVFLAKAFQQSGKKPSLYIGASAIGFYGDRGNEILDEGSAPGKGFLSTCGKQWENASEAFMGVAQRNIILRIGIVMSSKGGALPKIIKSAYLGRLLNYFGYGHQYQSWIHIDDLCGIMREAVQNPTYQGIINGVSPHSMTNKDMTLAINEGLPFRSLIIPVPAFMLKMLLGEMSHVVLDSTRVVPKKLIDYGFTFKHTDLKSAVADLIRRDL
ncbi:MAG: TIGR01777 family protein [Saprospiraceae bacterium]|nr:TIGR01777 family protein [Saprospiraceae bacterium]